MKTPMMSYPFPFRSAAATEESTPPLIPTYTLGILGERNQFFIDFKGRLRVAHCRVRLLVGHFKKASEFSQIVALHTRVVIELAKCEGDVVNFWKSHFIFFLSFRKSPVEKGPVKGYILHRAFAETKIENKMYFPKI